MSEENSSPDISSKPHPATVNAITYLHDLNNERKAHYRALLTTTPGELTEELGETLMRFFGGRAVSDTDIIALAFIILQMEVAHERQLQNRGLGNDPDPQTSKDQVLSEAIAGTGGLCG